MIITGMLKISVSGPSLIEKLPVLDVEPNRYGPGPEEHQSLIDRSFPDTKVVGWNGWFLAWST